MEELWRNRASIHKKVHRLFISGGSTGANTQLDEVQQWLDDHPGRDGDVNLDELSEIVEGLVGIYEAEEAKGSVRSNKVLIRCQALHHAILGNLLQRITAEMLKQADGRDKANRILEVGKRLDSLSAGKASMELEEHLFSMQDKALTKYTQLMTSAAEQMKEPSTLISGAQLYVDAVSAARAEVPGSLPVAELLLKRCMQLRQLFLDLIPQVLSEDDSSVALAARHIADNLDALADGLAAVKGGVWEPRTAPKAAALIQATAIKMLTAHLLGVRDSVAKKGKNFDLGAMVRELEAVLPWWQFMANIPEVGDRLTAVHDEVDKRMVKTIVDAAKVGDDPALEVALEAMVSYDASRAQFQGAGTAAVRLRNKLLEAFSHVQKQMAELEARMSDLDLRAVESSLTSLVPPLVAAIKIDASLLEKISGILVALRSKANQSMTVPSNVPRAEQMVAMGGDIARVSELMRWAERCDAICEKLSGLEALGKGYLAQSLRPRAVDACLKATEAQACRGKAVDLGIAAQAMEESWKAFASWTPAPPIDDRLIGLSLHLRRALIARMAIDPDALKTVSKCAKCADGALNAGSQGRVVADLSDTVAAVWPIVEQMKQIHLELAKASGMNPKTILGSLESMTAAWPSVSEFDEFRNLATEVSSVLQQRMSASFDKAVEAKSPETMDRLMKFASDFDPLFASLGIQSRLCEALDARVEEQKLAEKLPTLPTSSFAPPPRDSVPPCGTKLLAGPEWGGDSPRTL